MKIIGLLTAWASEDWIEYSIKQALELVDELIINIGPYNKYFKKIEDNTFKIAKKFFNNAKVKFVSTAIVTNDIIRSYRLNRCATLNKMLQASENIEVGNIIWLLDSDEFFSQDAIMEIKEYLKNNNNFDVIFLNSRVFCIDLNHYIKTSHDRIFKIKTKKPYFTPTQTMNPKPIRKITLLENNPMFHYSLLTGDQIRGLFWLGERKYTRTIWYFKIYKKYDPANETYWMKKNQELTGFYAFWFHKINIIEKDGHGLFIYNGKHPEIIESSHIKLISDFREYMRKKPNYEIFLETMKQIIIDVRKFNFWRLLKKKNIQIKKYLIKTIFRNYKKYKIFKKFLNFSPF